MLTQRREDILKIVIGEYISKGNPIGSESIARMGLKASSATIRNEMSGLEEEGYLTHPHTSAGRIPSDKGYRWYINSVMEMMQLAPPEQRMISHQFHQVEREVEEWTRLAATILSRMLHNVAIVTLPKPSESCLQHIELVSIHELMALLVVIFKETKLRHQPIALEEPTSQENLNNCARKLKDIYAGIPPSQISTEGIALSSLEERISNTVLHMLKAEEKDEYEEPYVDGLRHILNTPEMITSRRTRYLVEMLEQRSILRSFLPKVVTGHGIKVVIGEENEEEAMRDCSVVITKYGIPGEVDGAIGVVGPTRMQYDIVIPAVGFLSGLMSELVAETYG